MYEGKWTSGCSLVSNDAVSLLSGPTLMACPLRALQRPRSYQQPLTSHPVLHGQNNTLAGLHVCPNISHSQPVLTLGKEQGNLGQSLLLEDSRSFGIFFLLWKTHTDAHTAERNIMSHACFFFASDVFPNTATLCLPTPAAFVHFLMEVNMATASWMLIIAYSPDPRFPNCIISSPQNFCFLV